MKDYLSEDAEIYYKIINQLLINNLDNEYKFVIVKSLIRYTTIVKESRKFLNITRLRILRSTLKVTKR